VRGNVSVRLVTLVVGLFLFGLGIVFFLQAHLGLAPWDVLHQGIAAKTPLSFGAANVAVGLVVLLLAWCLGARPGFGTVANATLVGAFIQLLQSTNALPDLAGAAYAARLGFLVLGLVTIGAGSALYIGAGLGAGPRDSLMLAVAMRARTRVGVARAGTELAALGAGIALGGSIGLGTAAFALLIGPTVELSFYLLALSPLARPALAG
jgi:uncharacterized membrane protein YczE